MTSSLSETKGFFCFSFNKRSPENALGKMCFFAYVIFQKESKLQGKNMQNIGILGLCPTRWTVRASCFQRILDYNAALPQEWTISLDEKLQSDIRGRIVGCQAQMNTSDFSFGLNLGQRLFYHTDNLSRTLQQTKMSARSGKRVACLTKTFCRRCETIRASDHFIM